MSTQSSDCILQLCKPCLSLVYHSKQHIAENWESWPDSTANKNKASNSSEKCLKVMTLCIVYLNITAKAYNFHPSFSEKQTCNIYMT